MNMIFLIIIFGLILIIILLNRGNSHKIYQKEGKKTILIGRMDTPPVISQTVPWHKTNPKHYIGRMNTPNARYALDYRSKINPNRFIGRMDTPPRHYATKNIFCPMCGNRFSEKMLRLCSLKKKFFCESCGNNLQDIIY